MPKQLGKAGKQDSGTGRRVTVSRSLFIGRPVVVPQVAAAEAPSTPVIPSDVVDSNPITPPELEQGSFATTTSPLSSLTPQPMTSGIYGSLDSDDDDFAANPSTHLDVVDPLPATQAAPVSPAPTSAPVSFSTPQPTVLNTDANHGAAASLTTTPIDGSLGIAMPHLDPSVSAAEFLATPTSQVAGPAALPPSGEYMNLVASPSSTAAPVASTPLLEPSGSSPAPSFAGFIS